MYEIEQSELGLGLSEVWVRVEDYKRGGYVGGPPIELRKACLRCEHVRYFPGLAFEMHGGVWMAPRNTHLLCIPKADISDAYFGSSYLLHILF